MQKKSVAVIGVGRVGLPLALVLADCGFTVFGIGRNQEKMERLATGTMPFFEKGAQNLIKKYVKKTFYPTTDYAVIKNCTYIVLTLGTPLDENSNPDYDQIDSSLARAKRFLSTGQTLILRSTVSPQTTEYVRYYIEKDSSLQVGKNFFLAYCPERIAEGKALEELRTIPQIVGGVDEVSAKKASALFRKMGVECTLSDSVSVELAKLFTNMYRYINFAIANEFMVLADSYDRDIYEITNLVNKNYKRGGLKFPGMTAGPCLFKDGFFLTANLPFADLISTSWKINEAVPLFLINRIKEKITLTGKKTAILGLAFKAEIDDPRGSLSAKVRKALLREHARVSMHDPHIKVYDNEEVVSDVYKAIEGANLVFIATNHSAYAKLSMKEIKKRVKKNCVICDIWNVLGKGKIIYKVNNS